MADSSTSTIVDAPFPATGPGARAGEYAVTLPARTDDDVYFIGRIRTPWTLRKGCPRKGDPVNGPICRVEVEPRWAAALTGIEKLQQLQLLYWMDQARRDLVTQAPSEGATAGTFTLRSPVRPNPIASSIVTLVGVEGTVLLVRGLDCLDGTPLLDIKPDICSHA